MKLDVMRPEMVIDINALERSALGHIEADGEHLRLGALVRMADAADHPVVRRDYPIIAQSLLLAASAQLRNMGSLGGNVLQRTRCTYFRDVSYSPCNKRNPGSGCAAMGGINRMHAVLGTSDQCIATYPGDFAQALMALDADVEIIGPTGVRSLPFSALHRMPGMHRTSRPRCDPGK
jgi:xanthine dehydrogenase YagS FAD-binding subunit